MRNLLIYFLIGSFVVGPTRASWAQPVTTEDVAAEFVVQAERLLTALEGQARVVEDLQSLFEKECLTSKGEIAEDRGFQDAQMVLQNGDPVSCLEMAQQLAVFVQELQRNKKVVETMLDEIPGANDSDCANCPPLPGSSSVSTEAERIAQVVTGSVFGGDESPADLACRKKEEDSNWLKARLKEKWECDKKIACNLMRATSLASVLNHGKLLEYKLNSAFGGPSRECIGGDQGDCLSEAVAGVLIDLWSNVELGKMMLQWAKNKIFADDLVPIENKTSDAALIASQQSPQKVAEFEKDPKQFAEDMNQGLVAQLTEWMSSSIKKNYGCRKWSGRPHFSTCVEELKAWDCADCNQQINVMCGVVGVIGGEALATVIMAFLSGGTMAVGKHIFKGSAVLASKVSMKVAETFPRVAVKAARVGGVAGKGFKAAAVLRTRLAEAILSRPLTKKILAMESRFKVLAAGAKAGLMSSRSARLTLRIYGGVQKPAKAYLDLLDRAYKAGFNRVEKNRIAQWVNREWEIVFDKAQRLDKGALEASLRGTQATIEETVLSDGTKAASVTLPPPCGRKIILPIR